MLAEIANLKSRGFTADAIVIDFVFKNIQLLKHRVHPAYLFISVRDPSEVIGRKITEKDVLSRVEMMLRGVIVNEGAPQAYSTWGPPFCCKL